jgi:Flp pilus assembly protein TadD
MCDIARHPGAKSAFASCKAVCRIAIAGGAVCALWGSALAVETPTVEGGLVRSSVDWLQALDAQQIELARKRLDLAYAYSPHNAEINFAEGNLHLALGEKDTAKSYYFSALRLDPVHVGAYNNLGVLALQESRWELAIRFFRHALEHAPNNAKLYFLLAQAELRSGERAAARQSIKRAVELDPSRLEFRALQQDLAQPSR